MTSKDILQQWQALRPQREALLDQIDDILARQRALLDEYHEITGLPGDQSACEARIKNIDQRIALSKKHNALSTALIELYALGDRYHEQYVAALDKEIEARRSGQ